MGHAAYLRSSVSLEGKIIFITGAGGGIGQAISKGLANAGAEVVLCSRTVSRCQPLAERRHG